MPWPVVRLVLAATVFSACAPLPRGSEVRPRGISGRDPIRFEAYAEPYVSDDLPACSTTQSERTEPSPKRSACGSIEACAEALRTFSCDTTCGGMGSKATVVSEGFQRFGEKSVPILADALEHGSRDTQALAAFCLLRLGPRGRAALPALIRAYRRNVAWALNALCAMGDHRATPSLIDAFVRDPGGVRGMVGEALVEQGDVVALARLLRLPDLDESLAASVGAWIADEPSHASSLVPVLLGIVSDETVSENGRSTAAVALPALALPSVHATKVLVEARRGATRSLQASLDFALVGLGDPEATQRLVLQANAHDYVKDRQARCRRVEAFVWCDLDMFGAEALLHPAADKVAALEVAWLFWKSDIPDREQLALKLAGESNRSEAVALIRSGLSSAKWDRVLASCRAASKLGSRAAPLRDDLRRLARDHWSNAVREAATDSVRAIAGKRNGTENRRSFGVAHLPEHCRASGMLPAVQWSGRWWLPACRDRIRIPADLPTSARNLEGLSAAMRLRDGWLVGTDRGEWGGKLHWQPVSGERKALSSTNVVAIEHALDQVLVFQGLAHLWMDVGQISRVVRARDGSLHFEPWLLLPGAPRCVLHASAKEVVLVAGDAVISIDPDGRIRSLPCARPCVEVSTPLASFRDLPPFTRNDQKRWWIAMSFDTAVQQTQPDELNETVMRSGYSSLPTTYPQLGFAFDGGKDRIRFTWNLFLWGHRSHTRLSDGERFDLRHNGMSAHVGYDLYQHRGFSAFAMLGTGWDLVSLEVDPLRAPIYREVLRSHEDIEEVGFTTWQGIANLGVEQVVPLWRANGEDVGLLYGIRVGYNHRLLRGDWSAGTDGPGLGQAPDFLTSGLRVRFSLGFAASSLRW